MVLHTDSMSIGIFSVGAMNSDTPVVDLEFMTDQDYFIHGHKAFI